MSSARIDGFDWDVGNREKCQKHGLSIEDVEHALSAGTMIERDPSPSEARYRAVGMTGTGRHAFIVFTLRGRGGRVLIRPVSARYMHAREVRRYEETKGA